jgi:microcystin-dependent protein
MSQPYIGEIRMFAGSFAPAGWAFCHGQTMAISENDTLFNLIGTTYGGDGQETFCLPDLQGRVPVHQGSGAGLTSRVLGERGGVENVTLSTQQIPPHAHQPVAAVAAATTGTPTNNVWAASAGPAFVTGQPFTAPMVADAVQPAGGSQPHENRSPALAVSFIIALYGVFPSQS